jgi:hypothetical protein
MNTETVREVVAAGVKLGGVVPQLVAVDEARMQICPVKTA